MTIIPYIPLSTKYKDKEYGSWELGGGQVITFNIPLKIKKLFLEHICSCKKSMQNKPRIFSLKYYEKD